MTNAQTEWGAPLDYADDVRRHLASEPVVEAEPLESRFGPNVNQVQKAQLEDGTEIVFKPQAGEAEGKRRGVPDDTLYRREAAASLVADLMGLGDLVPPTTVRTVDGERGSAQLFVPGAAEAGEVDPRQAFDGADLVRAAVFDYLIGHSDRHRGNWLLKDGKLVLIDNGFAFPVKYAPTDYRNREFLDQAARLQLPLPHDLPAYRPYWGDLARVLKQSGLEPAAVELTHRRFDALTSGRYPTVADLPAFWGRGTLRDYMNEARPARTTTSYQDEYGRSLRYDDPDTPPEDVMGGGMPPTPDAPVEPEFPSRGINARVPQLPDEQFRVQANLHGLKMAALGSPDPRTAMINYLTLLAEPRFRGVMGHFGVNPNDPDGPRKVAEHVLARGYTPRPPTALPSAAPLSTGQNEFADFVAAARGASRDAVEFNGRLWDALRNMAPDQKARALDAFGIDPDAPMGEVELLDRAWDWANNPANFPAAPAGGTAPAHEAFDTPERRALREAPVAAVRPLDERGANASAKLVFQDGTAGVFKPIMGEEPGLRRGIEQWGQAKREAAASVVADLLGFGDLVPPTVLRTHEGKEGSLQRFMPGMKAGAILPNAARYDGDEDLARAAVLDYILGNTDRHSGNWLVQNPGTPQAKLVLIDHGLTLPHTNFLSDFAGRNHMFWNAAAGKNLPLPDLSRMAGRWPEVEAALHSLRLDPEAIALAKKRYDWVMSGRFATVGDLPAYYLEDPVYPERPDKPLPPLRSTIF